MAAAKKLCRLIERALREKMPNSCRAHRLRASESQILRHDIDSAASENLLER
jgi:hypothetical protein